jgi:hypothetical protein
MRQSAYPKWIAAGKMKQAKADEEIEAMQAVEASIEKLAMLEEVSAEMRGPMMEELRRPEAQPCYSSTPGFTKAVRISPMVKPTTTKEPALPEQESLF